MIPVLKEEPNGEENIVWIDYASIKGWGLAGSRITVVTMEREYYWINDIDSFQKIDGCVKSDRSAVVKIEEVKRYDKNLKTLHFHDTNHNPYLTVSRGKKAKVEEMLKKKGRTF